MVYFSFFLIFLGVTIFLISLVLLIYRVVNAGGWGWKDLSTVRNIKMGLIGIGLAVMGQMVIWLAL